MSTQDTKPLISVLLPVFNVGHYLPQCLDSLFEQSYQNIEVIAFDDFSRDDSWKILKIYKKFDNRIKIYRNVKHYGKGITLNRLLTKAKGQYIVFMDAKDILYKDKIKRQLSFLTKNPQVVAAGVQCTFIDGDNKRVGKSEFPNSYDAIYHKPLHGVSINFETIMINKLLLPKDLLHFDTNEKHMLYSDLLIKLLQYGQLTNLPYHLQYRRTENSLTSLTAQITQMPHLIRLWLKSIDAYDYRPKLQSFLFSIFKPNLSTN